ncbi:CD98 heavy chain isoform X2 [Anticarsia gemmatalis]
MADAKYVVEDHRNGDAKIELDANKKQFTGLSKEELMKYAEDPFWVNLRWFMFILFWAMWVCMLAGAITIIIKAPKCAPPTPRTWFQKGPLVEMGEATYDEITPQLPQMQSSKVQGIFVDVPTYEAETPNAVQQFKDFVAKAKDVGIKVIVDLIPNYVSSDHAWFQKSVKKEEPYTDYFVWRASNNHDKEGNQTPPTNWVSTMNESAWTFNKERDMFYLHQYGINQPDLNFDNEAVVKELDNAIRRWMKAGAAGVRLNKARQILVNATFEDENPATGRGSEPGFDHTHYGFYRHQYTSDLPQLDGLLTRWSAVVEAASEVPSDSVFTLAETGRPELFLLSRNLTSLRPLMTAPLPVSDDAEQLAKEINKRLAQWPAMQLVATPEEEVELAPLALLLPAAPVFDLHQVQVVDNDTTTQSLSHLVSLRDDASVEHGHYTVAAVPARNATLNTLLACARWKAGHTGYVAVFNPSLEELRANLTALASVPDTLTVHHMSHAVKAYTNYTNNYSEGADNVLVPPKSAIVLSYVPKTAVEN